MHRYKGPADHQPRLSADVILATRKAQSEKPEGIYSILESLAPGGKYLEIFGRRNNLRDFWVTIGNQVIGVTRPNG